MIKTGVDVVVACCCLWHYDTMPRLPHDRIGVGAVAYNHDYEEWYVVIQTPAGPRWMHLISQGEEKR